MSSLIETLRARQLVAQTTGDAELEAQLAQGSTTLYVGYDPTGPSLHVGHLVTMMVLRHMVAAGHRPLVLVGGGTAYVGEPSGKSTMRPMLSPEQIASNAQSIGAQIAQVVMQEPKASSLQILDNAEWLLKLDLITFLREIGRHFPVNRMLSMEVYRARLASGLSFLEFSYQLLQAYDFLELNRRHSCQLQLGGDDQWGNIVAGVDLCRRVDGKHVHGMTVPLLTTASGAKMGKTADGAVWLDPTRLAPYGFYQFWLNIDDADVWRFLKIFTLLPLTEIEAAQAGADAAEASVLRALKRILAFEVCGVVHGAAEATAAHGAAQAAFGGQSIDPALLPSSPVPRAAAEAGAASEAAVPTTELSAEALAAGVSVIALLVQIGWCRSNNEARRLLEQGGVRLGEAVVSGGAALLPTDALDAGAVLLRAGKRRVHRLVLQGAG